MKNLVYTQKRICFAIFSIISSSSPSCLFTVKSTLFFKKKELPGLSLIIYIFPVYPLLIYLHELIQVLLYYKWYIYTKFSFLVYFFTCSIFLPVSVSPANGIFLYSQLNSPFITSLYYTFLNN